MHTLSNVFRILVFDSKVLCFVVIVHALPSEMNSFNSL